MLLDLLKNKQGMGFPIIENLAGVSFQCWLGQYRYKNKHNLLFRKCLFFTYIFQFSVDYHLLF